MPATDVERLIVSLEARTKEYEKALAKAQSVTVTKLRQMERQTESFSTKMSRSFDSVGYAMKGFATGAAVAAVAALGMTIRTAIKDAAQIGDLADKIGLTTDQLQGLNYGATQANLGLEDLGDGLAKFSKNIAEAMRGGGDLLDILKANGVALRDAAGNQRPVNDLFRDYADLVKNAASEQDALLLVTTAFGRGNDEFVEFLRNGSEGLAKFGDEATAAGAKIDEGLIRKAQELDDKWAAVMLSMKVQTQSFVLTSLGYLEQFDTAFNNAAKATGQWLGTLPADIAMDPSLAGRAAGATGGAISQKGDRKPTIIPQKSSGNGNDALRDRLKLIKDIERALEEADRAAAEAWQTSYDGAYAVTEFANEKFLEQQQAMRDGYEYLAQAGVDAFEGIALRGEKLGDVLGNLAQQLASMALQAAVFGQGPLAGLFGTGGSGGIFGSLLGRGAPASLYHSGGRVGGALSSRRVNPAIFAGAPRMHGGGLAGDEVPAILQRGERVLSRAQSGMPSMKVTVNNYGRGKVETSRRADGGIQIDVDKAVAKSLASGRSDGALRARFGTAPAPKRI